MPESRARPTTSDSNSEKVGRLGSNVYNGSGDSALLALLALLKNKGIGLV